MTFSDLGLSTPILEALNTLNISVPTPIQAKGIPVAMEGRDLVGLAQTGTGKTAAFSLPIIHKLSDGKRANPRKVHALVLAPTRELAQQIEASIKGFSARAKLKTVIAVGGKSILPQAKALSGGADILIATPGRLEDLMRQGSLQLDATRFVVLDEADQMMDIGFMPAIRRILAQAKGREQTMLFSATMPKEIRGLADKYLNNPVEVSVTPPAKTADKVEQGVIHISSRAKTAALSKLIAEHDGDRVIVFARTKHGADKIVRKLGQDHIEAAAIHGNKSQGQRQRALDAFRDGSLHVLVATDIAARGIDVPGITLVVNHDLPNVPDVYVHRIGRTARAGRGGLAISFCAPDERSQLRDIEKLIKLSVPVMDPHAGIEAAQVAEEAPADAGNGERKGHRGWSGRPARNGNKAGNGQKRRRPPREKYEAGGNGDAQPQERRQHAGGEQRSHSPANANGAPKGRNGNKNRNGGRNRNGGSWQGQKRQRAAG